MGTVHFRRILTLVELVEDVEEDVTVPSPDHFYVVAVHATKYLTVDLIDTQLHQAVYQETDQVTTW